MSLFDQLGQAVGAMQRRPLNGKMISPGKTVIL